MVNVLRLGLLILASLITSGVGSFSNTGKAIVAEFEKDDGNTKISISPHDSHSICVHHVDHERFSETMENSKEKLIKEDKVHRGFSPKELVCDVYGVCKRKIESALGKVKEGMAEDIAYEVEDEAREVAGEAVGNVKDMASHAAQLTSDKARGTQKRDAAYKAYDKAREAKEGMKDAASEAKDKFGGKAGEMKDGTRGEALEMVENDSKIAEKGAYGELSYILRRAREVAFDRFEYAMPPVNMAFVALHLLGFATAYGMCVWGTFASSYVLDTSLPRHQCGVVQSKIYPVYFKAMAYSVGMAFLGHLMSSQTVAPNNTGIGIFQAFNLVMSIVMILVNLLYLQPRATKVMLGRMKEEKEEKKVKPQPERSPKYLLLSSIL